MAWALPAASGTGRVPLQMLGRVADRVLLHAAAEDRLPGVARIGSGVLTGAVASALICRVNLFPSGDPDQARTAVDRFVASLAELEDGYPRHFVDHIIQDAIVRSSLDVDDLFVRSIRRAELVHQDPEATIGSTIAAMQRIGVPELVPLASRHLSIGASRAVLLVPNDKGAGRSRAMSRADVDRLAHLGPIVSFEESGDAGNEDDSEADGSATAAQIAQAPGAAAATVSKMANGLTLIVLPRPGLPFVTTLLGFHAEAQPTEPLGVRVAALRGRWHHQKEAIDQGLLQDVDLDLDSYSEDLSLFSDATDRALTFLDEETDSMFVRWPIPRAEALWATWKAWEVTPEAAADTNFAKALWNDHPYGRRTHLADLQKVTANDIEGWLDRVRRPRNGALIVVGDVNPAGIQRQVEHRLGRWKGSADPVPLPPAPPEVTPATPQAPQISFTMDRERQTTDLQFGCLLPSVHSRRESAINGFLAALISGDLRHHLRHRRGASYSTSVHARYARGGSAWLEGSLDVRNEGLGSALRLLRSWLAPDAPIKLEQASIERARLNLARGSNLWYSTNKSLARGILDAWIMGWSPAVLDDYPRALASITPDDLQGALRTCGAHAVISIVGREPIASAPAEAAR